MVTTTTLAKNHSAIIVGGGPVGMTLAALLAKQGIQATIIEADPSYCTGSRAICVSRRSQEILGWVGADKAMSGKGLPWSGGRSYYRDTEVLHFQMPSDETQRFAPMLNIQQFYVEEFSHKAGGFDVMWNCKVIAVRSFEKYSEVDVALADGANQTLTTDWLIACDGGRSTVREQLGLSLQGIQYEGRYVIVDIEQDTQRPVERLAWFDPPSNPGSTILMHRQPDNVWRIDYQVADDEDPIEAVKPENVLPRVQSHLAMIGENAPWKPLWISIYNAKCLTLPNYQHNRVFFAGDAAHLVPIFGVRGLNSGLDDAGNLAWKLAAVIKGDADERLLKTYTHERLQATQENIVYGAKSTEFMAPPHAGFQLMREAALRLAVSNNAVSNLLNPRQSTPIAYSTSNLNGADLSDGKGTLKVGMPAPEALLINAEQTHLTQLFGKGFVALHFVASTTEPPSVNSQKATIVILGIEQTQAWQRYEAKPGQVFLIRPDGYILAIWHSGTVGNSERQLAVEIDAAISKAMRL